jgi:hypothetical protein
MSHSNIILPLCCFLTTINLFEKKGEGMSDTAGFIIFMILGCLGILLIFDKKS